jgi:mRNA interferase RelE/StbE
MPDALAVGPSVGPKIFERRGLAIRQISRHSQGCAWRTRSREGLSLSEIKSVDSGIANNRDMDLIYSKEAIKAFKRIQPKVAQAMQTALSKVAADPFGTHRTAKPMEGTKAGFRLRHGDWRIIFVVNREKQIMTVVDVKPRGGAYR